MSKLKRKMLERRKQSLEDLIYDLKKDKAEAERLIERYEKSLIEVNKEIENEN